MAKEPTAAGNPTWNPGAWTPKRCAVWNKLSGQAQADFVAWVSSESKRGECHPHQVLPEHEGLL